MQRSPFLVPLMRDTLTKMKGFQFATTIDTSMGHWCVQLDLESQDKCVITTPWGRHAQTRLPMGLSSSANVFQERMSWLVEGIENVFVCVDDLLILSNGTFEEHMTKVDLVLQQLKRGGLKVKPQKCKWAMTEVECLGHWITRKGVQPMTNKVEAM